MPLLYAITAIARGSFIAAALVLLFIFAGGMAAAARAAPVAAQSHDAIEVAIQRFVAASLRGDYVSFQAKVGALDPRLRLAPCGTALRSFLPPGSRLPGNATVGVTCDDQRSWTIYVPVAVKVTSKVAVMERLVTRGSAIGAGDIGLELRELGTAQTYLRDPAQLIGKMAKRSLAAGVAVTPEMVAAPLLVRRGQQVVIVANIPGVDVRMQGVAMNEGGAGDRIQVRNQLSKRIVEATVVDVGVAQVAM